jgi:hypothetical protein
MPGIPISKSYLKPATFVACILVIEHGKQDAIISLTNYIAVKMSFQHRHVYVYWHY